MKLTKNISYKLHGIERKLCISFMMLIVALFGLYIYFVGKSIVNVVVREEVEMNIAEVNSEIADLELKYITKKGTINMVLAKEMGFNLISKKIFINKGTLMGGSLTQRNAI